MTRPAPALRRSALVAFAALVALAVFGACASPDTPAPAASTEADPPAPTPLAVSAEAFGSLRWLEGRWRGTMPDGTPFFEAYRVADDSTLRSYTLPDSTTLTPSDSGMIALRGGTVASGSDAGGPRWVVTELADGRVHFEPEANASNAFTWERRTPDAWVATLRWPATAEAPAREVVYPMRRLPR